LDALAEKIVLHKKNVFISLRRFNKKYSNHYREIVLGILESNPDKQFIFASFEPREVDPDVFELASGLARSHSNIQFLEFRYNPVALYFYFKAHANEIISITPQYHGIALAYQAGIRFFPLSYDNKCSELLVQAKVKEIISIHELEKSSIQNFIEENYESTY
jgi:hypothetical protein